MMHEEVGDWFIHRPIFVCIIAVLSILHLRAELHCYLRMNAVIALFTVLNYTVDSRYLEFQGIL